MKLLVIGGLHGNEPLGLEVVERLGALNDPRIDVLIGNPEARRRWVRYVDADLNRVFPGSAASDDYEIRRAYEVSSRISENYDLVLDFHNTHTPGNDCGFVGDRGDRTIAAEAARFLRLPRLVIANYDCVNRYFPRCLSVELSLSSPYCRSDLWVSRILNLAGQSVGSLRGLTSPPVYRFVGRITREHAELSEISGWKAFRRIASDAVQRLNLPRDAQAMFVADEYTPANYSAVVVPARLRELGSTMQWDAIGAAR